MEAEKIQSKSPEYDYVFGFGSIINTATHAPWLALTSSIDNNSTNGSNIGNTALQGQRATILATFGFKRGWTYRSPTGFTALGVYRVEEATDINGVLFRIKHDMLEGFDRREVGYDRVEILRDDIELIQPQSKDDGAVEKHTNHVLLNIQEGERIWVYIPKESFCMEANEDHPILQSYVDTVLQGCLEWGGTQMAKDFVATTSNWSPYFLNDTPSSRRPWLFRKEYNTIDRILSQNPATYFGDRRHPEEFASAFLIKMMRGSWSVPRRNSVFTGRDVEIGQIHARLTSQLTDNQPLSSGVAKLEVAGMGGVGKTQVVTEYCYRYFPSYYGLVIWLRAPSAESIASGYRQLMADTTGADVNDKDTDEVVSEVKARLFRSKVPWLLVFDNLDDHSLLEKFVPNGGNGHVLVTTRLVNTDNMEGDQTMILKCFDPSESVELLCRAAGKQNISNEMHLAAANKLADYLGHLPLALGMAAAYMRKCDVDCSEYLSRYSESSGTQLGHEAVSSSLSLSLEAIKTENLVAWNALRLLCWLGPDQITKKLLRSLFMAKIAKDSAQANRIKSGRTALTTSSCLTMMTVGIVSCSVIVIGSRTLERSRTLWRRSTVGAAILLSASTVVVLVLRQTQRSKLNNDSQPSIARSSSFSGDVFEQADQTWEVLKSFSILVVKDKKGSMHRLLAQALRQSQDKLEAENNLDICLQAASQTWTFKPADVATWQESASVLEHVKAVVSHSVEQQQWSLQAAVLSSEAGVFSAMALNRFEQAQAALEESLLILDGIGDAVLTMRIRATSLYELGRVFRYEGNLVKSEEALKKSLDILHQLARKDPNVQHEVAATLHELGVLEVKKHNLDSAATFLQQALGLRRKLEVESPAENMEAECASTLHQLAAVHVAQKPPALDQAELLLKEALALNMQLYQRAGTLKLKARVAIRRGDFDIAEKSLAQALELYVELYGESTHHINVAAVKFQQGTLAFQRAQYEQAWLHFSDCLRTRRHVYAYSQGNHLEVSSVLHKLGCVAFAQKRISKACEMLTAEKEVLDQLHLTSSRPERLLHARLTNLTWLRKCAKEKGAEDEIRKIVSERQSLERKGKQHAFQAEISHAYVSTSSLQRELLHCRSAARHFAMSKPENEGTCREELNISLQRLSREMNESSDCPMKQAALIFLEKISESLSVLNKQVIFEACDDLRDSLRKHGTQVVDSIHGKK